ncbi:hypothetical protein G7046_g7192 [Stylonectria norvegica]|nr:hypothetical protein G7046_g7192 [Stylonectria norvegica]
MHVPCRCSMLHIPVSNGSRPWTDVRHLQAHQDGVSKASVANPTDTRGRLTCTVNCNQPLCVSTVQCVCAQEFTLPLTCPRRAATPQGSSRLANGTGRTAHPPSLPNSSMATRIALANVPDSSPPAVSLVVCVTRHGWKRFRSPIGPSVSLELAAKITGFALANQVPKEAACRICVAALSTGSSQLIEWATGRAAIASRARRHVTDRSVATVRLEFWVWVLGVLRSSVKIHDDV